MADFWGRLFFTDILCLLVGVSISGSSQKNGTLSGSQVAETIGALIAVLGILFAAVSAFAYIWTC